MTRPRETTGHERLSPAEHIAGAFVGAIDDEPRQLRVGLGAVEIVLVSVIAGVTLVVVAGLIEGLSVVGSVDVWTVLAATSNWAQLPISLAVVGTGLLAWYQNKNLCDKLGRRWVKMRPWVPRPRRVSAPIRPSRRPYGSFESCAD